LKQNSPKQLYSAEQSRQLDRIAIEQFSIPGITLMKRAGRAAFQTLLAHWPQPQHISVFCGGGNNGGDGYIVAALAAQQHIPVSLFYLSDPAKLNGDAALARDFAAQSGVQFTAFTDSANVQGVVVDAMLGTGSKGAPRGDYAKAIALINSLDNPVLAIDIPSGLDADTGAATDAVRADATITFIGTKRGLLTGRGPALTDELVFNNLELPEAVYQQVATSTYSIDYQPLPPREQDAHKGASGHVLILGGDEGMGGAVAMAAEAAARTGAGLVSVATQADHVNAILARCPEVMVKGIKSEDQLAPLLSRANVLVVGPGLGQSAWSRMLWNASLTTSLPKVVDADGLNMLAEKNLRNDNWVLTPHPGEAARLLSCDTNTIQNDRFCAASKLRNVWGGVVILKGAGSLVASASGIGVCRAGNPGMASGGMGDVLSGVIGALIAQGLSLQEAAETGVQIHAMAGDRASQRGQRGMLATDLMPHLRSLVNGL